MNALKDYILKVISNENGNAYGVVIRQRLEEVLNQSIPYATLYSILERLESEGMIYPIQGEATPERGNRPKVYFKVTELGEKQIAFVEGLRREQQ